MAASNINVVALTGNLTKDPELRTTPGGTSVCKLRVAVNTRRKSSDGEWVDKPNYFDVTVWGKQGENAAQYLSKGRPVAVQGRLEWREWEASDGSGKRQAVDIVADSVQFLNSRSDGDGGGGGGGSAPSGGSDVPGDSDFEGPQGAPDDDIPF
jgi:single-strand DNA-binding protein